MAVSFTGEGMGGGEGRAGEARAGEEVGREARRRRRRWCRIGKATTPTEGLASRASRALHAAVTPLAAAARRENTEPSPHCSPALPCPALLPPPSALAAYYPCGVSEYRRHFDFL